MSNHLPGIRYKEPGHDASPRLISKLWYNELTCLAALLISNGDFRSGGLTCRVNACSQVSYDNAALARIFCGAGGASSDAFIV